MLNILINSYTCCPGMGSEQGMGWNWIINLAKYCNLYIISEGEYRGQVEVWMSKPHHAELASRMHFYWIPVSSKVRSMCWDQGDWRFYWYYARWQRKTAQLARSICKRYHIDVLHQLNMIGFHEPGYLADVSKETGIPLIWGPVDAKERFPMAYAESAPTYVRWKLRVKNFLTWYSLLFSCRIRKTVKQSRFVVSASSNSVRTFRKYYRIESPLINETGCYPTDITSATAVRPPVVPEEEVAEPSPKRFKLLWVGKFLFRKQLGMALRTLSLLPQQDIELHIVGGGDEAPYREMAQQLGVSNRIVWHGEIPRSEVLALMHECDLFFFTSVAEGTPHVVMEAISCGLPILCINTCGHGDCVTPKVGVKVSLNRPDWTCRNFAETITRLYKDRALLNKLSTQCKVRIEELSWEARIHQMLVLYEQACKTPNSL